jgi:hypothetical protein
MPVPGLTDIYAFGDWMKRNYAGDSRKTLVIQPVRGGLIRVDEAEVSQAGAIEFVVYEQET